MKFTQQSLTADTNTSTHPIYNYRIEWNRIDMAIAWLWFRLWEMKICSHLRRYPSVLAFIRAKYPAKHIFAEYKSELENTHWNCTHTHSFSHSEAWTWARRFTMCFLCKAPTLSFAIVSHGFYVWYLLHDMNFVRMCLWRSNWAKYTSS